MSADDSISIGGVTIPPGEAVSVHLPLPRLYTRSEFSMPVRIVNGRRPGPCLLLCAALHGDEVNGTEIIRRLLATRGLSKIRGTLVAVPVVNVYGFVTGSRYSPDRRDLNRSFPGSTSGSLTSRLAKLLLDELVSKATHVVDLHTGALHRPNLPQVRVTLGHQESDQLASAFGAPVVLRARLRDGSLRKALFEQDKPAIVYETGEALRFDDVGIRVGVRGLVSVLRHLGMLKASMGQAKSVKPYVASASSWVRAPISGLFRGDCALGDAVSEGDVLGWVSDPLGDDDAPVTAASDGIIIGRLNLPLVHQGDALLHIGQFRAPDQVASGVKEAEELLDDPDPI